MRISDWSSAVCSSDLLVIEDRGRHLDGVVALDHARRLEPREGEGLDEFLERDAVLQADRDGDGEVVHQAAEGGAFLVHVDEDLAELAVLVFAGAQIDLVAAKSEEHTSELQSLMRISY